MRTGEHGVGERDILSSLQLGARCGNAPMPIRHEARISICMIEMHRCIYIRVSSTSIVMCTDALFTKCIYTFYRCTAPRPPPPSRSEIAIAS